MRLIALSSATRIFKGNFAAKVSSRSPAGSGSGAEGVRENRLRSTWSSAAILTGLLSDPCSFTPGSSPARASEGTVSPTAFVSPPGFERSRAISASMADGRPSSTSRRSGGPPFSQHAFNDGMSPAVETLPPKAPSQSRIIIRNELLSSASRIDFPRIKPASTRGFLSRRSASGTSTTNSAPFWSSLCTVMAPPISAASRPQIASPRPVPPNLLVVEESAWLNGRKIPCCLSSGIPIPESFTESMSASPPGGQGFRLSVTTTSPLAVNFRALLTRLARICRKRTSSPLIQSRSWLSNRASSSISFSDAIKP